MTRYCRRLASADDGFAMLFTLMFMFVLLATSIAVAGVFLSQARPTQYEKKFVRTGDAAEAGLQAGLGTLRNTQTSGQGDLTKLPCSDPADQGGVSVVIGSPQQQVSLPGDQISGSLTSNGQAANTAAYRAVIVYFASDPTSHETDSTTSWWTSNAIPCRAGLVDRVPSYAFIQSFGSGSQLGGLTSTQANRAVHGVYQFSATNSNTVGGRIPEYGTSSPGMCMDAGASPAVGSTLTLQPCLALGTPRQTWQYRTDLSIFYGGDTTLNLCVQNVSSVAKLEPCTGSGSGATYPYSGATQQNQEWGYNDNGHFAMGLSNGDVTEGTSPGPCLQPGGAANGAPGSGSPSNSGDPVVIAATCDSNTTGYLAWNPDPQVGAGKAGGNTSGQPGAPTNQLVNYAELGRCLDITGQNVGADHLIDYPCKQAPNSCLLTWNQVWYYTAVSGNYGTLAVQYAGGRKACDSSSYTNYCLTAPSAPGGGWITVSPCQATPPDSQLWQTTGNIAGNYPNSFLVISKLTGLCMAADPSQQPTYLSSTIVTTACDGSGVPSQAAVKNPLLLKWNAPAYNPTPGLGNIQEDSGSGLTHNG
ncbi:MAG: ricin-type beta-trefoil lectin domain protein [Frankiales bacterium]|nr:ricin-type beta-trefoil lectin domain protein [Frankiales bacterium]